MEQVHSGICESGQFIVNQFLPCKYVRITPEQNYRIALKFDRNIDSTAADVLIKFESDGTIPNAHIAASSVFEILQ